LQQKTGSIGNLVTRPITGVVFFNPAAGVGLRIMFSRKTMSNLCIDFGFGADGTKGIFFNLNETF
jgi:hypothetical protein